MKTAATEADTCRKFVVPKLQAAGWDNHAVDKGERYYQQIAVNRTVEEVLKSKRRLLLTMATGTGKTAVAFQICWKLWSAPDSGWKW